MNYRCTYRRPDGSFCKRWAGSQSSLCSVHRPKPEPEMLRDNHYYGVDHQLHPVLRLVSPRDAFDLLRECISAVRFGQMSPGQAFALCALLELWYKMRSRTNYYDRNKSLRAQMLVDLVDNDAAAEDALESLPPVGPATPGPPLSPPDSSASSTSSASATSVPAPPPAADSASAVAAQTPQQVDLAAAERAMMALLGHIPDNGDDLRPSRRRKPK